MRIRSRSEIFATLDEAGALDGLPFMPEMLQFCGRTFSVSQRADRTCAGDGVVRHMQDTVHLGNVRCDGAAHAGCQAACLLYWKEAWLERADGNGSFATPEPDTDDDPFVTGTLLPMVTRGEKSPDDKTLYRCQATEIPTATGAPWRVREVGQYAKDVENFNLRTLVRGLVIEAINLWQAFSSRRLPRALRIADGRRYPFVNGTLEKGETPRGASLELRPGELVRIKSKAEIVATLDETNHNRGLSFDGMMASYCGRLARVRARVNRIVDEHTGELIEINSDCIILEGVICAGDYYRFCTRAIYSYWREIWLERVDESTLNGSSPKAALPCGTNGRACS